MISVTGKRKLESLHTGPAWKFSEIRDLVNVASRNRGQLNSTIEC
jgi:hypothetical protein